MGEFEYLSGVIPMILAEFIIILVVTLFVFNQQRLDLNKKSVGNEKSLYQSFFYGQSVEHVYLSHFGSKKWNYILLTTRSASLLFFLSVDCIWNYVKDDGFNYRYFTQWNIDWICVYFLLVTLASIIGLYHENKIAQSITINESKIVWSESIHVVSNATQVIFEVTGASAFFVTVVAFGLLDPKFRFWNVSEHFITSLAILLELCLNSIPVRAEHVVFNVGWALLYLFYIWPAVTLNTVKAWPYDFLKTESPSSYVWYTILVVINLIFYFVWYGVFRLKERYLCPNKIPHLLSAVDSGGEEAATLSGLNAASQTSERKEGQLLLNKDVSNGDLEGSGGKGGGGGGSAYAAVKGPMRSAEQEEDIENRGL